MGQIRTRAGVEAYCPISPEAEQPESIEASPERVYDCVMACPPRLEASKVRWPHDLATSSCFARGGNIKPTTLILITLAGLLAGVVVCLAADENKGTRRLIEANATLGSGVANPSTGPDLDEGPATVDLTSSLGFTVTLGAVEPIITWGEYGIAGGTPDGLISTEIVNGLNVTFFNCYSDARWSCLSENPSLDSFNSLAGIYKDATGTTLQTVMQGKVPDDPYEGRYAALNSTWRDPVSGVIHGWYHAEAVVGTQSDRDACAAAGKVGPVQGSIGYATSTDGGHWFTKQGIVITGYYLVDPSQCGVQGTRSPTVIESGEYLYLFYENSNVTDITLSGLVVARALKSNPGVWHKYYNGAFTEPGLGGAESVVMANSSSGTIGVGTVSWNSYLNKFVVMYVDRTLDWGWMISTSNDLIHWSAPQLVVPHPTNYRYSYPSQLSNTGKAVGQNGWLYFARFVNGTVNQQSMARRTITLTAANSGLVSRWIVYSLKRAHVPLRVGR